jgi:hypothetical protein
MHLICKKTANPRKQMTPLEVEEEEAVAIEVKEAVLAVMKNFHIRVGHSWVDQLAVKYIKVNQNK